MNKVEAGRAMPLWQVLRHRAWLAGGIFVLSQLVALACWFILPHQYRAQAVVLLDAGFTQSPTRLALDDAKANALMAKVTLLSSSLLADDVIKSTGLNTSTVLREAWARNAPEGMSFEQWLQLVVIAGVVPDGTAGSLVLKVGYVATSPEFAKAMANSYAESLIRVSDLLNRGVDRFAGQAFASSEIRARAEYKAAMETLQQRTGREVLDEQLSDPALRAFIIGTRQTSALVRSHLESVARQRVLEQGGDPGSLLDDAFSVAQRDRLGKLRAQRAEVVTSMGDGNPVLKALDASIASLERTVAEHERKRRMSSAIGVDYRAQMASSVTKSDQATQTALLDRERRRLAHASAQQAASAAGDRYEDAAFSAEITALNRDAPRTDVRFLSAATLPTDPWFPSLSYYVPVALTLGLLMAMLGAYLAERNDRRVRSLEDVSKAVGTGWVGRLS
jgi:polysaccharide biosynthesis transport protein